MREHASIPKPIYDSCKLIQANVPGSLTTDKSSQRAFMLSLPDSSLPACALIVSRLRLADAVGPAS